MGGELVRSGVMGRAWVDEAAKQGALGVDGVRIAGIEAEGADSVRMFLDGLAGQFRAGTYPPEPWRRVHIPNPGRLGLSPSTAMARANQHLESPWDGQIRRLREWPG
jgi:hypothetical protein